MNIEREIESTLRSSNRSWFIREGSRHRKIVIDGKLVGILPMTKEAEGRAGKNVLSQVRRAVKGA